MLEEGRERMEGEKGSNNIKVQTQKQYSFYIEQFVGSHCDCVIQAQRSERWRERL